MICPLCEQEVVESEVQPMVRCVNKLCTAYHVRINTAKFKEGMMVNFTEFWDVYPRKAGKLDCIKAWIKLSPDKALRQRIVISVAEHRFSEQWENPQYIPLPATWIRGRKWEDTVFIKEIPKPAPSFNAPIEEYHKPKPMPLSTPESKNKKQQAFDKINKMLGRPTKKLKEKTGKQNKFDFMVKDFDDLEEKDG